MDKLLYISILPVIVLLLYIYKKDVEKEPRGMLILIFIIGCLSTIPIAVAEVILGLFFPTEALPTLLGTLVAVFMTIAIVEEFGKWVITYIICYRNKEFNHVYDGIVYAVYASLGFACIENLLYVFTTDLFTGFLRAILSVPSHAVDAVFMGYLLSISKKALVKNNNGKSFIFLLLSILVPSIVHAIYDALLFRFQTSESWILLLLFFGFVIVSYIVAIVIVNIASKDKNNIDGSYVINPVKQFCPQCGKPLVNRRCNSCGFKDN